jgi:glycerophosphoryl diester phosphodiesterase
MVKMVAHRGWSTRHPENSIKAIQASIDVGCQWVEFDVQLSGDEVPMVFHDASLNRTTGLKGDIFNHSATGLTKMPLKQQPSDLQVDKQFIPRLSDVLNLLQSNPQITFFVEIKDESLNVFDIEKTIDALLEVVEPYKSQCVIIAFDWRALADVRRRCDIPVGWILENIDAQTRQLAEKNLPEYLICNHHKLAHSEPWPGPWLWMLYEINEPSTAAHFTHLGIDFIETSDIGNMLVEEQAD